MSNATVHNYQAPSLWLRFRGITACQQCGLAADNPVHAENLKDALSVVRGIILRKDWGPRRKVGYGDIYRAVMALAGQHGAVVTWSRQQDADYLVPDRDQLRDLFVYHWRKILPSREHYSDCENQLAWLVAWATAVQITVVEIHDYSPGGIPHAYGLLVYHEDGEVKLRPYDPGGQMTVDIGPNSRNGKKYLFQDIIVRV